MDTSGDEAYDATMDAAFDEADEYEPETEDEELHTRPSKRRRVCLLQNSFVRPLKAKLLLVVPVRTL